MKIYQFTYDKRAYPNAANDDCVCAKASCKRKGMRYTIRPDHAYMHDWGYQNVLLIS